jgi:hypothetical protein
MFSSLDGFCVEILQRKGSTVHDEVPDNELKANMEIPEMRWSTSIDYGLDAAEWSRADLDIKWDMKTKIDFQFSVPANASRQYFDLKKVVIYRGACVSVD